MSSSLQKPQIGTTFKAYFPWVDGLQDGIVTEFRAPKHGEFFVSRGTIFRRVNSIGIDLSKVKASFIVEIIK